MAALVCLSIAAGSLAGCSDSTPAAKSGKTDEVKKEEEPKKEEDAGEEGSGSTQTKLSIFMNMSWYPVDSFTGKIPDKIKEKTGVDLDVTIATDANQLGVMIASGELPDLVYTDDTGGNLSALSNSNICYSLDELKEETGVDFSGSENYEERSKIAQSFSSDGQAYTLLNNYNTKADWENLQIGTPGVPVVFFRKDLLEAENISVPKNLDEFYDCLGKVKEAYPEMTPFGQGGVWKMQAIANWFGVTAEQYNVETGEYVYYSSADSYKEFLEYCNKLYRAGYISAEDYAVENEADGHQKAYNNGCVFYPWFSGSANLTQLQANSTTKTAEWAVLNPLGEAPIGDNKGYAGAFIPKTCKDPKAAATLVSFLNTQEGGRLSMWGVEGDDYTLNEDGVPQFSENYLEARKDTDKWYSEYNTMFYMGASAITEIYQSYGGIDEEVLSQFSAYGEGFKNYPEIGIAAPLSTSDEGVIKTKLEELRKNYEAKVIFTDSDEAFESAYAEFMDALNKTGVEKYNTYMTERIAEVKEEFGFNS